MLSYLSSSKRYFKKPTFTNSWHVQLEVRIPFKKIIYKRALSEIFENKNKFYAKIFNITG
jgi:hypothetical protein